MLVSKKAVKMIAATQDKKVGKDFYDGLERQVSQMIILACTIEPKSIIRLEDIMRLEVIIK